ncbi:MAG: aminoacyl-tRNA deacylase [Gaiellaceae bacterium]
MRGWPEPVERVASRLRLAGIEATIEEFAQATSTAQEAAERLGCTSAEIVKTIVLLCDREPVAVLVPGDRRVSLEKVGRHLGTARVRVAGAAQVVRLTGFAPGAVAPFPLERIARVLIDDTLLGQSRVWAGAGSQNHLVGLQAGDLAALAQAEPVDVTER